MPGFMDPCNGAYPQPIGRNISTKELNILKTKDLDQTLSRMGIKLSLDDPNLNIITGNFESTSDLVCTPDFISNLSQDFYFSNQEESTWCKLKVEKGKFKKVELIATIRINSFEIINKNKNQFDFIRVGYTSSNISDENLITVIPYSDYTDDRIIRHFPNLIGQTSDRKEIGKLVYYLLSNCLNTPALSKLSYIGMKQGFSKNLSGKIQFSPRNIAETELKQYLPKGLLSRQFPTDSGFQIENLRLILKRKKALQVMVLFRVASWYQSFFAKRDIYSENILIVKPSTEIPDRTLIAFLNNLRYDSLDVPAIGPNTNPLKFDLENVGDGMVTAIDLFSADQIKKAEKGYDLLLNDILCRNENENGLFHISVLISNYAHMYLPAEFICILDLSGASAELPTNIYKYALEKLDCMLVAETERACSNGEFVKLFNGYINEVQKNIPDVVPMSKRSTYIMLLTAFKICGEFNSMIFDSDIEGYILNWLANQENRYESLHEVICSEYARILNQKISSGYFRIILKEEVTPFDKGGHILVVNRKDRCIYLETAESIEIAKNEMKTVDNSNSLTAALYSCEYIPHNSKSEKSVRIAAVDSEGIPYSLYVHMIKYTLVTKENRQLFELLDKQDNLFAYDEFPKKDFLPLIKTGDGRFAGKMLIYEREESNIYFGTGRTGSGKSWAIAQIISMLFMLNHTVVVFDVSRSYTKQKLLNMLPADAVENLFRFYNIGVGEGMDKIPVNLGSIRECQSLPDKKRAIGSIIRAAAGRISKQSDRILKSFLSEYLKDKSETVDLKELCIELKKTDDLGAEISNSIISVLNDINEIQCEDYSWKELLTQEKIIVFNLGNEVGDSTHQLLDMLVSSLFNWQMQNDSGFLAIAIDELADLDFSTGSPLNTIVKQGRKFHTSLIGATQDYFNQGSSNLDTMKQANIQSFCKPGKSGDRIAQKLGYSGAVDAGFNSFKTGDAIIEFDGYNKETCENEALTMKGRVVNFDETPLYEKFKQKYDRQ